MHSKLYNTLVFLVCVCTWQSLGVDNTAHFCLTRLLIYYIEGAFTLFWKRSDLEKTMLLNMLNILLIYDIEGAFAVFWKRSDLEKTMLLNMLSN